jgi:hypothetical protein
MHVDRCASLECQEQEKCHQLGHVLLRGVKALVCLMGRHRFGPFHWLLTSVRHIK